MLLCGNDENEISEIPARNRPRRASLGMHRSRTRAYGYFGKLDNIRHLLYAAVLLFAGLYGFYLLFRYALFPSDVPAEMIDEPAPTISETVAPNAE